MKLLAAAAALTLVAAATSLAAARADSGGITVSVSPDAIRAAPGDVVQIPLRVSNNETVQPVHFTIAQRALSMEDEGRITVLADADPAFAALNVPGDEQTLDPGMYRDYDFELQVPALAPDTYLIGLLVSVRSETVGAVNVQGQVATFATLDIPGLRDRRLHAELHLPGFHLGSSTSGQAVLSNVGGSSFSVWGEIDAGGGQRDRVGKTFLAAGRERSVPVSTSAKWGFGRNHVTLNVYHNITDSQTGVDTVTATVWLIHPAYIAEGVTVFLAASLALIEWLLRRRRARRERFSALTLLPRDRRGQSKVA
jgi:hypothetical protein